MSNGLDRFQPGKEVAVTLRATYILCRVRPFTRNPKYVCALAVRLTLNSLGARTRRTEGRLDHAHQCCLADVVPRPRAPRTILAVAIEQPHAMEHVVRLVLWQPSHLCQSFSTS